MADIDVLHLWIELKEPAMFVALISGMNIGDANQNPVALQLCMDFILGHLGGFGDQTLAAQISRVVIAGNSVSTFDNHKEPSPVGKKEVSVVLMHFYSRLISFCFFFF